MSVNLLQKCSRRFIKRENPHRVWNSLLNTGVAPNMQLAINGFPWRDFFPDSSATFCQFPHIPVTAVKFRDISRLSRQVVTLYCVPTQTVQRPWVPESTACSVSRLEVVRGSQTWLYFCVVVFLCSGRMFTFVVLSLWNDSFCVEWDVKP